MTQVLDQTALKDMIAHLSSEIGQTLLAPNSCVIGIRRRGVPLAQRLIREQTPASATETKVGVLDISFYRDDLSLVADQPISGVTDIPFSIDDRVVYLVDDVLYTGRTIRAAIDAILEFGRPKAIKLVVLVDRGHRELPIKADFVGLTLQTAKADNVTVHLTETDDKDEVILEGAVT
jgi:pyrimidine operon attenuation protein / uracil phosphoribosyltransferase